MIRLRAVKLEVNTSSGLFGAFHRFENGLNIIRGNNSAGKSTLFQTILYCLGLEELLGGRNEKTMQSVLKEYVWYEDNQHPVIESCAYLEIQNDAGEIVTIKRYIKGTGRNPKLVEVFTGAYITNVQELTGSSPMYVHDGGAATDEMYGFHYFLEEFIGWNLPEIPTTNRAYTKLYLQVVAPAFIIEQKAGWSDFMATAPYYNIKDRASRAIEFLMKLDVFENQKRKQEINQRKAQITDKWKNLYLGFQQVAQRTGGELINLSDHPEIINDTNLIRILKEEGGEVLTLEGCLERRRTELADLEKRQVPTVGVNLTSVQYELNELTRRNSQFMLRLKVTIADFANEEQTFHLYEEQVKQIRQELKKNKSAKKVSEMGAALAVKTSQLLCPTCNQHVEDSLLPAIDALIPMQLDENISYLESQEKMVLAFIKAQQAKINEGFKLQEYYQSEIEQMRSRMRTLEQELTSDERLPSEADIEKKVNLKNLVNFYSRMVDEVATMFNRVSELVKEWEKVLADEKSLPNDFLSGLDRRKLGALQDTFKTLLRRFNYQSNGINSIIIPTETYIPTIKQDGVGYNIRFDSSASDLVRCIWSYSCALYKLSLQFDSNHPGLLMFDEPAQHSVSDADFRAFLMELASYTSAQVLVFASFNNNESSEFERTTEGISFQLDSISKLIRPLS
jgi:hypothetical protein